MKIAKTVLFQILSGELEARRRRNNMGNNNNKAYFQKTITIYFKSKEQRKQIG